MHWTQWLSLVLAVVPCVVILRHFVVHDAFSEPGKLVWGAFFIGLASIIPTVIVEVVAAPLFSATGAGAYLPPLPRVVFRALFAVALIEEGFKFLVLRYWCMRRKAFDEPMDGIVYGVAVSMGFAVLENLMYVMAGDIFTALIRAVTAVPGHALFGAAMGYYAGQSLSLPEERGRLLRKGFLLAVLLHAAYDAPLFYLHEPGAGGLRHALGFVPLLVLDAGWKYMGEKIALVRQRQADGGTLEEQAVESVQVVHDAADADLKATHSRMGKKRATEHLIHKILGFMGALGSALFGIALIWGVIMFLGGLAQGDIVLVLKSVGYVFVPFGLSLATLLRCYKYL